MTSVTAVNLYICANVLLVSAVALLAGISTVSTKSRHPIAYLHQLRFGQVVALAAVLLPFVSLFSSHENILPLTAQVWSAPTMQAGATATTQDPWVAASFASSGASIPLDTVSGAVAVLLLAGMLVALMKVLTDGAATIRIIAEAQTIRCHGRLRILASEEVAVPFSFWRPARYFIVVPSSLALRTDDLKMAIRHEGQPHRQQDTKVLYLYSLLKAAFFWNPAVYRLEKNLRELQELACDEALSQRRPIAVDDYCQCLLRVAEAANRQRGVSMHTSMLGGNAGMILKRRIEALLAPRAHHVRKSAVVCMSTIALTLMAATALAFTSTIHDRRISAEEASRMASFARQGSTFPIVLNDRVLEQLNLLLATPDGRTHLQASLARMQDHQALISAELIRHDMPLELLAVPLVESGYRNLPQGADSRHGAGLWMFITPTARNFGLTVDANRDERLDVAAETAAAMQHFEGLHRQFNDWGLALLGYNAGSARVEKAIRETGSRDVWKLIGKGYENDPNYLARATAAILILKNPSVLDSR